MPVYHTKTVYRTNLETSVEGDILLGNGLYSTESTKSVYLPRAGDPIIPGRSWDIKIDMKDVEKWWCAWCHGHTFDDERGHCAACGGPRG